MLLQLGHGDVSQCVGVGAFEHYRRSHARIVSLFPTHGAKAPPVAGFQAGKPGRRRHQIVAATFGEVQKSLRYHRANHVYAVIVGAGMAKSIAVITRFRFKTTGLERGAQHISGSFGDYSI